MYVKFFLSCFGVGILSTLGLGPIFILTFNRSALHGFLRGFATALGAALADGLLFSLGLAGFLSILDESISLHLILDLVGGFLLIGMGIYFYRRIISFSNMEIKPKENILMIIISSFLLTVIHPGSILFFAYMSMQVLEDIAYITMYEYTIGVILAVLGCICSLSIVSIIASRIGLTINKRNLRYISKATGAFLILVGLYFIYDFFKDGGLALFYM